MIELNPFLQPIDAPISSRFMTDAYKFGYTNERGAVTGMFIQDASINNAKIGTAAIGTANIGTLTFNEIAGGTAVLGGTANGNGLLQIKDASGSVIIQGDNLGHHYRDTSGGTLVEINAGGFTAYGSANVFFKETVGGNYQGFAGASGTAFIIASQNNANLSFLAGDNKTIKLSTGGTIEMVSNEFQINGTVKTAIVPTSSGYNALYTNESPDVWFMDFCESKEKIDPMFLEVTSPPYHFIKYEDGEYQVWGKRRGFENTRFESKTKDEFDKNNIFWSQKN